MTSSRMADSAKALLESWWQGGDEPVLGVYGVLDGAKEPKLLDFLRRSRLDYTCLISGRLHPRLARAAPYLVSFGHRSAASHELLGRVWGRRQGIFLRSTAVLQELARHLGRFLDMEDPGGNRFLLRFYDPPVLPTLLPLATGKELDAFFGPVLSFELEAAAGDRLRSLRWSGGQLMEEIFQVIPGGVQAVASATVGGHLRGGWAGLPGGRLRLRQVLWDALSGEARREFVERALTTVQRCWPHTTRRRGSAAMRALVERALVTASVYGLRGRREALHFINWALTFGEDFDREPWSSSILMRDDLSPTAKIDILLPKARRVLAREVGR